MNGVPVRFGHGEHTTGNGMIYKGQWESDKMNGKGEVFFIFYLVCMIDME